MSLEILPYNGAIGRPPQRQVQNADWRWDDLGIQNPRDPRAQLRAWIDRIADGVRSCDFEPGCGALELCEHDSSAGKPIGMDTKDYRDSLAELCARAGLLRPDTAAELLILMGEGARASCRNGEPAELSVRFRKAAEAIVVALSPGSVR